MSSSPCPICCDTFTAVKRKMVECPAPECAFKVCKQCLMKFLLEDTYDEAYCMSCRVRWPDALIKDSCTKTFWKGPFSAHLHRMSMDRERNLLTQSEEAARAYKVRYREEKRRAKINEELRGLRKRIRELKEELIKPCPTGTNTGQTTQGQKKEDTKPKAETGPRFLCPADDCRGTVGGGQCGLCEAWICMKCLKPKKIRNDPDHTCDENDIKTVTFIKRDSKPCPSCKVPIHKISGCHQMWCTLCHTAFDWVSLKILNTTRVHNPHMIAWMRKTGQGNTRVHQIAGVRQSLFDKHKAFEKWFLSMSFDPTLDTPKRLFNLYRLRNHFSQRYAYDMHANLQSRLGNLRIKYLVNEIDEKQWSSGVKRQETMARNFDRRAEIFQTFVVGADNILNCEVPTTFSKVDDKGMELVDKLEDSLERLRFFVNKCLEGLANEGHVKDLFSFEEDWDIHSKDCKHEKYCGCAQRI